MAAAKQLPAFALFPIASWRDQLLPDEWVACLQAWLALVDSHLSLSDADFLAISVRDDSLKAFLVSFSRELALDGAGILGPSSAAKRLLKDCLLLATKVLQCPSPPNELAQWEFLADLSRVYGKKRVGVLLGSLSASSQACLDASLAALKKFLIKNLHAGLDGGDLGGIEERLERVNDLIRVSPAVAEFFLAGSDFLDGLIACYKITNLPLRKALIATTYLCLMGLAEAQKVSALTDQLYSLKSAAEAHRAGPLNVNDSLVAELVTSTPLLQRLQHKLEESGGVSSRARSVLAELSTFKKQGSSLRKPKRLVRRKIDKGKGLAEFDAAEAQREMHVHRMSQISQVQDLFPELGSAFIAKLLDEYDNDTEQVIAHLLDDSLPAHLQSADRTEDVTHAVATAAATAAKPRRSSLVPRPTPPHGSPPPSVPNNPGADEVEEDNLDLLTASAANLHIGKRPLDADTLLSQRAPNSKAAILSALAAFDSDDDERDDTYDAADVGGTVDAAVAAAAETEAGAGAEAETAGRGSARELDEAVEATLYRAWTATPGVFGRDGATRRGAERARLREETGLTDEAVEGWAVMVERDGRLRRRLQARYGEWTGEQAELPATSWRRGTGDEDGDGDGDGDEDGENEGSDRAGPAAGGSGGGRGRGRGGRGRGRGGGGRGRGGAAPPADSEYARRRKEANKASRANHNRRDQRARKMARAGFAG